MSAKANLVGKRFGKLVVVGYVETKNYRSYWRCKCDCGGEKITYAANLTSGNIKSCGCLHNEALIKRSVTHGESASKLYRVWATMLQRCTNSETVSYPNYGGRGISVCEEWHKYETFRDWAVMSGYEEGLQIDRINTNGDYCPLNCRWVTRLENSRNKRNIIYLTVDNETKPLYEWAVITNQSRRKLYSRKYRNWTDKEIVFGRG